MGVEMVQARSLVALYFLVVLFPKDEAKKAIWWQKRDGDVAVIKDPCVCSEHFTGECFERNSKFELLNPYAPLPLSKATLTPTAYQCPKIC